MTRGEVLDNWAERHGLQPPAVVRRDVGRREAGVVVGLVLAVALVTAAFVFRTASRLTVAWLVIAAAGLVGYVALRRYRLLAGPGWIATDSLGSTRVVRLDRLTRLRVGVGGPRSSYLRLYDADGGMVALERRTTLPPVRSEVMEAVERGLANGTLDAPSPALAILSRGRPPPAP